MAKGIWEALALTKSPLVSTPASPEAKPELAKEIERIIGYEGTISVPGKRHTATFGSPIAANPRVRESWNFVVTSLSPTFAGRDATRSRL